MSGVFITATGTEIGKTYLTCALLHQLRGRGLTTQAIKPVASGYNEAQPESSDTYLLARAQNIIWEAPTANRISPWRFAASLSPDRAAELEGRTVDEVGLLGFCAHTSAAPGITLIEGAGGAMSPLTSRWLNADLMARLNIPSILVAGSYLGSIGHCLAVLEALSARHVPVLAIVLNETRDATTSPEDTIVSLRRFCPAGIPILPLRRGGGDDTLSTLGNLLAQSDHERKHTE